jgi:hypothetical protein
MFGIIHESLHQQYEFINHHMQSLVSNYFYSHMSASTSSNSFRRHSTLLESLMKTSYKQQPILQGMKIHHDQTKYTHISFTHADHAR